VDAYAEEVFKALQDAGIRVEIDTRPEKINYKIREHSLKKVPLLLVLGKKEAESKSVALRRLGGENQEMLSLTDAVAKLREEAESPLEREHAAKEMVVAAASNWVKP
jgi:threonyl-tRNA synthetase